MNVLRWTNSWGRLDSCVGFAAPKDVLAKLMAKYGKALAEQPLIRTQPHAVTMSHSEPSRLTLTASKATSSHLTHVNCLPTTPLRSATAKAPALLFDFHTRPRTRPPLTCNDANRRNRRRSSRQDLLRLLATVSKPSRLATLYIIISTLIRLRTGVLRVFIESLTGLGSISIGKHSRTRIWARRNC